jgi:hydrogenase maturation factor
MFYEDEHEEECLICGKITKGWIRACDCPEYGEEGYHQELKREARKIEED